MTPETPLATFGFNDVLRLLREANEAAQRYLETKDKIDLMNWQLAAWRIGHEARCAEMRERAMRRLEERKR